MILRPIICSSRMLAVGVVFCVVVVIQFFILNPRGINLVYIHHRTRADVANYSKLDRPAPVTAYSNVSSPSRSMPRESHDYDRFETRSTARRDSHITSTSTTAISTTATVSEKEEPLLISQDPDIDARGEWQREQVEKFCEKYGESDLKFTFPEDTDAEKTITQTRRYKLFRHLLFDDERKLILCFIPKVGCTNLRRFFFLSQGLITKDSLKFDMADYTQREELEMTFLQPGIYISSFMKETLSEEERLYKIRNYFKFTFVRHPLERLLSAFLDKIAPPLTFRTGLMTNPDYYQRQIVQRHRKKKFERWQASKGAFELRVTFSEFIEWLLTIDPNLMDEHFAPIIVNAQPCRIRYDFYGNFKMYSSDMTQLIKKLNGNPAYFISEGAHKPGQDTKDYVRTYYSQLSNHLKELIVEHFSRDLDFYYHLYPEDRGSHIEMLQLHTPQVYQSDATRPHTNISVIT